MDHIACMATACAMLPIQTSDVVTVRTRIAGLTVQWGNIGVGHSMRLVF
jgi:hypothetical protein